MRKRSFYRNVLILTILFLTGCQKNEVEISYPDPLNLGYSEFTFIPLNPTSKKTTNLVFYDCSYYKTFLVNINKDEIYIKKHFNGQLKWPCKIVYDTISLGLLRKGNYKVTLEIVDTNPFQKDSVFYSQSKTLVVGNN